MRSVNSRCKIGNNIIFLKGRKVGGKYWIIPILLAVLYKHDNWRESSGNYYNMEVDNDLADSDNLAASENLPAKMEQSKILPSGTNILVAWLLFN